MAKVKVILLKPLDGAAIGSEAEYDQVDFDRLVERGAVKAAAKPQNKAAKKPKNKKAPPPANKSAG